MPFYRLICYYLYGCYTFLQCYLEGSYLTFNAGVTDIEEAPIVGKYQEVWIFTIYFSVFWVCDRWKIVEDRSYKYGGHHEMINAY